MANKRSVTTGKLALPSEFHRTTRKILLWLGVVSVFVLVIWVLQQSVANHGRVNMQSQRFDRINHMLSKFETNVDQILGSSITSNNKASSCYYPNVPEFGVGNGPLYCKIEVTGTAKARSNNAKIEALQIASSAKSVIQSLGVPISTNPALPSVRNYGANGSVDVSDTYWIYGQSTSSSSVRCDVNITTPFTANNENDSSYVVKSLEYSFNCSQKSSNAFFPVRQ